MSATTTTRPEKLRDGEHDWLPPGYFLRSCGWLSSDADEPFLWNVYRPDVAPIGGVLIGQHREDLEWAAWRRYRREVLRELEGGGFASLALLPEGYALFVYSGLFVLTRPDGSEVCDFPISATTDRMSRAAWDDYRRRTLRVLRNAEEREGGGRRCG